MFVITPYLHWPILTISQVHSLRPFLCHWSGSLLSFFYVAGASIRRLHSCGQWLQSQSHLTEGKFCHALPTSILTNYSRSHGFYYIFSAFYIAELLASFIASITLPISPWIPSGMAFTSVILCLLLLWLMPPPKLNTETNSTNPLENHIDEDADLSAPPKNTKSYATLFRALSNTNVLLTIPVFLVGIFRYTTLNVLIQYASTRFGMSISTGALFYTETAVVNIFLFLFLIPRVTAHVREKYNVQPQRIDLFLVRSSVFLMCCGALGIGLAWTGILLPLGRLQPR